MRFRLYVTKNFGQTFDVVQDYVRNFFFQYGPSETKLYVERIHLLANETTDMRVTILSSTNFFEKHIDTEVVYRSAVHFQLMGDFLFVTRYRDEKTKDHLDLFISQHGERFVIAKFPFSEDKNITHLDYHIIDVTDDGQVIMMPYESSVNIYDLFLLLDYDCGQSRSSIVEFVYLDQNNSLRGRVHHLLGKCHVLQSQCHMARFMAVSNSG